MLPFSISESFADKEVVEIVDFIRTRPIKTRRKPGQLDFHVDRDPPIMTITKEVEVIKVRTGTQEHGPADRGQVLEVTKTDQGYELMHVIEWVS